MRVKKGDTVKVLTGVDRGKTGKVLKVFPEKARVVVEGTTLIKRHSRPSQRNPKGGIVQRERSMHISNVPFEGRKQRWRDRTRALNFPHAHERSNSAPPARGNSQFATRNPKSADALFISSG